MTTLNSSLLAWQTNQFEKVLIQELLAVSDTFLPLQKGLQQSSIALSDNLKIIVFKKTDTTQSIMINIGVFYHGIISGCACADDPTPVDRINEYCDIEICLNRDNAKATARLLSA